MDEHEFQRLITRYERDECTPEEKQQLESWLSHIEKQPGKFEEWNESDQRQVGDKMLASLLQRIDTGKRLSLTRIGFSPLLKIAASLLLLIGFGYIFYQHLPLPQIKTSSYQERTSTKGVSKYMLADGTLVWLKGNSKLSFPATFTGKQREVHLEGEALFEVAKDTVHPFIVHCGRLRTTVVGTSFNMKSTSQQKQVEVVVFTGKVKLSHAANKKEVLLLPNQKALYKAASQEITKSTVLHVEQYVAGTQYNMKFEDTPLWEVIERIEQKFSVEIDLENQRAKYCLVGADLTDQSLTTTLKLISEALGGNYQEQGKKVLLKIPDCY
ncbi:FecR family protein [Dyadobacter alkalitolerans]|uniref:FecR family protein n=1 Tax=Dyadobacter alkalitolerans TaxID=492736 RepID=UPI00040CD278|nr:FecR family protein [Dyadobacter alkalitolerans]